MDNRRKDLIPKMGINAHKLSKSEMKQVQEMLKESDSILSDRDKYNKILQDIMFQDFNEFHKKLDEECKRTLDLLEVPEEDRNKEGLAKMGLTMVTIQHCHCQAIFMCGVRVSEWVHHPMCRDGHDSLK